MNDAKEDEIFNPNQTSASMLIKFAQKRVEKLNDSLDTGKLEAEEQRLIILYDLYIKARSYAILNKVFFWISIISAIAVLLWPSLSVILQTNNYEWLKSAVVQTTVTGIAALAFAFYSQYKDKQTYTENLMRFVLFSKEEASVVSEKVIEEIAKIDKGFSFAHLISKKDQE
ncbi:MAG: hypothetical protein HOP36_16330 [Methyloglobulus sp.]|nr:hypothetical protein [Methyloglobulus sp.]